MRIWKLLVWWHGRHLGWYARRAHPNANLRWVIGAWRLQFAWMRVVLLALVTANAFADGPYQSEPTKKPRRMATPRPRPTPTPSPTPAPVSAEAISEPWDGGDEGHVVLAAEPATTPPAKDEPIPTPEPTPAPTDVSVVGLASASLGGGAETSVTAGARVAVDTPLAGCYLCPRLHVVTDVWTLPGETIELGDPQSFRSLELALGISQRLARDVNFGLFAEAGFASRLPGDPAPRVRAARWGVIGLRLAGHRGWLSVGAGADQRITAAGNYQPAIVLSGAVKLYEREEGQSLEGAAVYLLGSASLGLQVGWVAPGGADVIRLAVGVGR